jgi:hypothetical protein
MMTFTKNLRYYVNFFQNHATKGVGKLLLLGRYRIPFFRQQTFFRKVILSTRTTTTKTSQNSMNLNKLTITILIMEPIKNCVMTL